MSGYNPKRYRSNAEKFKAAAKVYREANPEKYRNAFLKRTYGISLEFYKGMLVAQGGACAICGGPPTGHGAKRGIYYVDHDHVTGKIRGLLCHGCNLVLGYAKDRVDVLTRSVEYLLAHKGG